MTFQDRIKKIEEYRPDISFKDGACVLKIRFKNGWRVIEPRDPETIAYAEDSSVAGMWWYVVKLDDVDELFDLIDDTIEANMEMEKKRELYKEKVGELKELFLSDITFDKLSTLQFTFPKQKKGKSAKPKDEPRDIYETGKAEVQAEEDSAGESEIDKKISKAIEGK